MSSPSTSNTAKARGTAPRRGGGRTSSGRGASSGRGLYRPQQQRQQQQSPSTPALAPSGVPYGYVPAYLPGSASLVEQLDQRLMIVLRDGRHLVGILRSFDQFSNMVMEDVVERKTCSSGKSTVCCDVPLGLYVVRGDSIVLLGQVNDDSKEFEMVSLPEFENIQKANPQPQELIWDFDTDLTA